MCQSSLIELVLPWPPSANNYKIPLKRGGIVLTKTARKYIKTVAAIVADAPRITGLCRQTIFVWPPDRRRRDVMNIEKVLNDALVKCGMLLDDYLIYDYRIIRMYSDNGEVDVVSGGKCLVLFEEKK